jgi:hypothetical protein
MKKIIVTTIALAFIASPALAVDFAQDKEQQLTDIVGMMDKHKESPTIMAFLAKKKDCVEKAADLEALKSCTQEFPAEGMQEAKAE